MDSSYDRLIPYKSQEELEQRVSSLFNYCEEGDVVPKLNVSNVPLPANSSGIKPRGDMRGVLILMPNYDGVFFAPYSPADELSEATKILPKNHLVSSLIREKTKSVLEEITQKSKHDLLKRNPQYRKAFYLASQIDALLGEHTKASLHVIHENPITETNEEGKILLFALSSMSVLDEPITKEKQEAKKAIIDAAYEKRASLPILFRMLSDSRDARAVDLYFELLGVSKGSSDFSYRGVNRWFGFESHSKVYFKKYFEEYDFSKHIESINDSELKKIATAQIANAFSEK